MSKNQQKITEKLLFQITKLQKNDQKQLIICTIAQANMLSMFSTVKILLQQRLQNLAFLRIVNCRLKDLWNLPELKHLINLDLSYNELEGNFQRLVVYYKSLKYLDVSYNFVQNVKEFQSLRFFKILHVYAKYNKFCLNKTKKEIEDIKKTLKNYGIHFVELPLRNKKQIKQRIYSRVLHQCNSQLLNSSQNNRKNYQKLIQNSQSSSLQLDSNQSQEQSQGQDEQQIKKQEQHKYEVNQQSSLYNKIKLINSRLKQSIVLQNINTFSISIKDGGIKQRNQEFIYLKSQPISIFRQRIYDSYSRQYKQNKIDDVEVEQLEQSQFQIFSQSSFDSNFYNVI